MGLLRQLRQLDERCVSPFEPRRNTQKRNVWCVGDVNWVTQANATQSKLAYVDDAGHAIIKVDNTTFVPYNYKRDSVSSPSFPLSARLRHRSVADRSREAPDASAGRGIDRNAFLN